MIKPWAGLNQLEVLYKGNNVEDLELSSDIEKNGIDAE